MFLCKLLHASRSKLFRIIKSAMKISFFKVPEKWVEKKDCLLLSATGVSFNGFLVKSRPRTVHDIIIHTILSADTRAFYFAKRVLLFTRKAWARKLTRTRDRFFRMVVEWLTIDFSRAKFLFFSFSATSAFLSSFANLYFLLHQWNSSSCFSRRALMFIFNPNIDGDLPIKSLSLHLIREVFRVAPRLAVVSADANYFRFLFN